jgi:hypothetical protein
LSAQCDYNDIPCEKPVDMLLLAGCLEGHVREKHLCPYHYGSYLKYLKEARIKCAKCGGYLVKDLYMAAKYESIA